MLRLQIVEHFDEVINEVDLFTEKKIQSRKYQSEEDWWNKRRQDQIDEIRQIERACLNNAETLSVKEGEMETGEWMKRALVEDCFTIDHRGLLFLAKANRFVEPKEKKLLQLCIIQSDGSINVSINKHQVNLINLQIHTIQNHLY